MPMDDYSIAIARLAGQGYCCAQIVLQMALELQGGENTQLIRAMSGLCRGFPENRGTCGALSGAACLLALYAGKGSSDEAESEAMPELLSALQAWFEDFRRREFPETTGASCSDIIGEGLADPVVCGKLVSACYAQAITLLVEYGFDLTAIDT